VKLSTDVKPITYLKTHTAEAIEEVGKGRTLVITQHGEARAVLMDAAEYDRLQEALAVMVAVSRGEADIRAGRVTPHRDLVDRIRERLREAKGARGASETKKRRPG
jgi:prevent-host-death family protein